MEKKPSFLINVITGRVVTRGQRHRVLVRDDRGVVVGVAEALDLVPELCGGAGVRSRADLCGQVSGLVPQRSSRKELNSSKSLRKFSTFFLRSTAFRTLQEGYKRATKRSDPTPPQCPPLFLFWAENGRILLLILPSREGTE